MELAGRPTSSSSAVSEGAKAATTILFTLRGKVMPPTIADARALHNKTAGSPDGIAG